MSEKELEITIKVRNNRILAALSAINKTVRQAHEESGISLGTLYDMINLKYKPYRKGEVKQVASRLAEYLGYSVEELFPSAALSIRQSSITKTFDVEDVPALGTGIAGTLASPDHVYDQRDMYEILHGAVETLTPKEAKILKMRFGLEEDEPMTLEEVGEVWGVNRERIRQIEGKALRKLRHPSRSSRLREFVDPDFATEVVDTTPTPDFGRYMS